MPKVLLFIFFFTVFLFFNQSLTHAQTMTVNPSTLTARDESGVDITISGLRTDLDYKVIVQRSGGLPSLVFGQANWDTRKSDPSGVLAFKLCGDLSVQNDCSGKRTFLEGTYEIWVSQALQTHLKLASTSFKVATTTSNITVDFLNTGWATTDDVVVQMGNVSDGSYLITVNDKDPSQGGSCFNISGGSGTRNLGKYFSGRYTLKVYDNRGDPFNPLCGKGSIVGQTSFTIASDGSGGPGQAIPPQTTLKLPSLSGSGPPSSGIPCSGGIETAIGCIPTDPTEFVRGFLGFAVGAAGGLALLIMAYGAFRMITSAGNPDSLKEGHAIFTNAIIGLLFIIFSTLLLKIIGVDILGLGRFLGI